MLHAGIIAPDESVTRPVTVPRLNWPLRVVATSRAPPQAARPILRSLMVALHSIKCLWPSRRAKNGDLSFHFRFNSRLANCRDRKPLLNHVRTRTPEGKY